LRDQQADDDVVRGYEDEMDLRAAIADEIAAAA